jgi:hypothetical protein
MRLKAGQSILAMSEDGDMYINRKMRTLARTNGCWNYMITFGIEDMVLLVTNGYDWQRHTTFLEDMF